MITGYEGEDSRKLEIPSEIGGVPVVQIGYGAFEGSSFEGDLIIPDTVTKIGACAFTECKNFTGTLVIPNSVVKLESYAFAYSGEFVEICNGT